MSNPMGVGIIGAGNISSAYLRLAPLFRGFEIRAIADLDLAAARARAAEFGVRAESVERMLAADDIDIVVNLTIPAAHFEVSAKALEQGKHVYSEKPVVLTMDKGHELRTLSEARGLRVGSAPDTFLGGAHQTARSLIDEGQIGKVSSGTAHIMGPGMESWHPNPGFFFQPGAGPIFDMGVYYLTNLVQLLGPIERVGAISSTARAERTIGGGPLAGQTVPVATPTTLHALLSFRAGASVTLSASWDVVKHGHAPMELYGNGGTLFVPDPNHFGGDLRAVDAEGKERSVDALGHPVARPNTTTALGEPTANYRGIGLADMVAAIQANQPHRCNLDLALHVVEVMNAVLGSAENANFIDIASAPPRPAPLTAADAHRLLKAPT